MAALELFAVVLTAGRSPRPTGVLTMDELEGRLSPPSLVYPEGDEKFEPFPGPPWTDSFDTPFYEGGDPRSVVVVVEPCSHGCPRCLIVAADSKRSALRIVRGEIGNMTPIEWGCPICAVEQVEAEHEEARIEKEARAAVRAAHRHILGVENALPSF